MKQSLIPFSSHTLTTVVTILLTCCLAPTALAIRGDYNRGFSAFSFDIMRHRIDLDYQTETAETRLNRFGFSYYEVMTNGVRPGVFLGDLSVTINDSTTTPGSRLTGHYLGLVIQSDLYQSTYLTLDGQIAYTFYSANDNNTNRQHHMEWHEFHITAGAGVRLQPFILSAGAYYQAIDGDEIISGDINLNRAINEDGSSGYYSQITYQSDATGFIHLRAEQGSRRSVSLIFSREFR